jgi:hypothetical protein
VVAARGAEVLRQSEVVEKLTAPSSLASPMTVSNGT